MLDVPEIERVLTAIDAKRAKDSSAIWTIDQLVWPFGSRQKKLSAGKTEILKLLIQSEVGAYQVIGLSMVPQRQWIQRIFRMLTEFHLLSVLKSFAALACTIFFGPTLTKLAGDLFYPCR